MFKNWVISTVLKTGCISLILGVSRGPNTLIYRMCVSLPLCWFCTTPIWTRFVFKKSRVPSCRGITYQPQGSSNSTYLISCSSWKLLFARIEIFCGVYDSSVLKSR